MRQPEHLPADILSHAPDVTQPYQLRMEAAAIGVIGCVAWLLGGRLRRRLSEPQ
jgi:hypothetical protein